MNQSILTLFVILIWLVRNDMSDYPSFHLDRNQGKITTIELICKFSVNGVK